MRANERSTIEEIRITPRTEDYSQWYLDIISVADLAEYGPTKGSMIIKPSGYSLWEKIQGFLDSKFKEIGVQNVYFPMLIPERLLNKEKDQALVYVGNQAHYLAGRGYYVLLTKENDIWGIKKDVMTWIS